MSHGETYSGEVLVEELDDSMEWVLEELLLEPAGVGRGETGSATSPSQANPTLWRAMDGQEHKTNKEI